MGALVCIRRHRGFSSSCVHFTFVSRGPPLPVVPPIQSSTNNTSTPFDQCSICSAQSIYVSSTFLLSFFVSSSLPLFLSSSPLPFFSSSFFRPPPPSPFIQSTLAQLHLKIVRLKAHASVSFWHQSRAQLCVFPLSNCHRLPTPSTHARMPPVFPVSEDDVFADFSPTSLNRYSMPVTRSKTGFYDLSSLDQTNTTRFLFGEDEDQTRRETKLYQNANSAVSGLDESFPTLTRREGQPHMVSLTVTAPRLPSECPQICISIWRHSLPDGLLRTHFPRPSSQHAPLSLSYLQ